MSPHHKKIYRSAVLFLLILVLANAFAAGLRTVSDPDMGWHLATGRYVLQHHTIPSTDVLSYTSAGTAWRYPPFAGVVLYLLYKMGGYAALSWFCALACMTTIAVLLRGRDLASAALAMCAIEPIAFRTAPRADLFTTVLFAILLSELWDFKNDRPVRLWLVPIIMLLWVNLHPGFILGLATIGAYVLLEAGDLFFAERRTASLQRLRASGTWLSAGVLVTLANPWGPKIFGTSLALAGVRGRAPGTLNTESSIGEFLSVPLSPHFFARLIDFRHPENGFSWLMLIAVVVIGAAVWQKQYSLAVIQAVALYLSVLHARYIALFCIATVIFGATVLRNSFKRVSELSRGAFQVPFALAIAFVCAVASISVLHTLDFISNRNYVVFAADTRFGAGEASWFPERAAKFILDEHLPANIFQEFGMGGFAAWRLGPEYPDFIDGRADHLAPAILVLEQKLMSQPPESQAWDDAADRWGINTLLISEAGWRAVERQDALGFCRSTKWRPVYMDEVSLVLLRNTAANQRWIQRYGIDCETTALIPPSSGNRIERYDFFMNAGGLLYALYRDQDSNTALQKALVEYPYDPNSELLMGQLDLRSRDVESAERHIEASLTHMETDKAWYQLGRLYTLETRFPDAVRAFTRAASLSTNPFIPYMSLGQVNLAMHQPELALAAFDKAEKTSPFRGAEGVAPELYAEIAAGRAEAYVQHGDLQLAVESQQKAVQLTPFIAARWARLADLLEESGQPQSAQYARERARELNTGRPH